MTRTLFVGGGSQRDLDVYDVVARAQATAISLLEEAIAGLATGAGADIPFPSGRAIDAAARDVIQDAGHAGHFGHGTGHGIGLQVHEGPSLSVLSKATLRSGMVVTVEPGIYIPGQAGFRHSDTILVTDDGVEMITYYPRDLESLIIDA